MIRICFDTNAFQDNWLASGEAFTQTAGSPLGRSGDQRGIDSLNDPLQSRSWTFLREQQRAHKEETNKLLQNGFQTLGEEEAAHREALETKIVNAIALKDAKFMGWWQILELFGKIAMGTALRAEALKLVH